MYVTNSGADPSKLTDEDRARMGRVNAAAEAVLKTLADMPAEQHTEHLSALVTAVARFARMYPCCTNVVRAAAPGLCQVMDYIDAQHASKHVTH